MDMPQQPMMNPGPPGMEPEGDDMGATKLCIAIDASGNLSYYTERDGQAESAQPARDIGAALKMALDAYRALDSGAESTGFDSVQDPMQPKQAAPRRPTRPGYGQGMTR